MKVFYPDNLIKHLQTLQKGALKPVIHITHIAPLKSLQARIVAPLPPTQTQSMYRAPLRNMPQATYTLLHSTSRATPALARQQIAQLHATPSQSQSTPTKENPLHTLARSTNTHILKPALQSVMNSAPSTHLNRALSEQIQLAQTLQTRLAAIQVNALQPSLTQLLTFKNQITQILVDLLERHPQLTQFIADFAVYGATLLQLVSTLASVTSVLATIGTRILLFSRVLLSNSILLAISAIAVAAFVIYKNWQTLRAFFIQLWQTTQVIFSKAIAHIKQFFIDLPTQFKALANQLFDGFIAGIQEKYQTIINVV